MRIYKVAIVGCGRIGSLFSKDPLRKGIVTHAAAYINNRQTKLTAACDIDRKRLEEFGDTWGVGALYTDIKDMLSEKDIDILSICTPPAAHYTVLKEAVKFPLKAVFCEKPLADKTSAGKEMVNLCRRKNVILQVDHQRRFDPLHIRLKKFIMSKKMGAVQQVSFYYTAGIRNTGSHMFDILRFFFGDVKWVEAYFSKNDSGNREDPNLDGMLAFKDGTIATFQACDAKKYLIFELNCFLDRGRIALKDSGFSLDLCGVKASKHFSGYDELRKVKAPFKTDYRRDFIVNGVTHILDCIRNSRESDSSGADALAAMKIIDAVLRSAKNNGRKIWID